LFRTCSGDSLRNPSPPRFEFSAGPRNVARIGLQGLLFMQSALRGESVPNPGSGRNFLILGCGGGGSFLGPRLSPSEMIEREKSEKRERRVSYSTVWIPCICLRGPSPRLPRGFGALTPKAPIKDHHFILNNTRFS